MTIPYKVFPLLEEVFKKILEHLPSLIRSQIGAIRYKVLPILEVAFKQH